MRKKSLGVALGATFEFQEFLGEKRIVVDVKQTVENTYKLIINKIITSQTLK